MLKTKVDEVLTMHVIHDDISPELGNLSEGPESSADMLSVGQYGAHRERRHEAETSLPEGRC